MVSFSGIMSPFTENDILIKRKIEYKSISGPGYKIIAAERSIDYIPRTMDNDGRLVINEIFCSIQGESTHAGRPCVFVRLTGCDLRCSYCDTSYAFHDGTPMNIPDILERVDTFDCPLVEVTGGEPLLQPGIFDLMIQLCDRGYSVLLETGGSRPVTHVDPRVMKIVDMKCPSSGMESHNLYSNLNELTNRDELKFVIADKNDFDWSLKLLNESPKLRNINAILFSPVHPRLEPAALADWIRESRISQSFPNARLQLAIQKYIWPDQTTGV